MTVVADEFTKGANALSEALVGHLLAKLENEANFTKLLHPGGGETLGVLGFAALADETILATDVGHPLAETGVGLVVLSTVAVSMLTFELSQFS